MKALEIARVSLLRTLRNRLGMFFIVILPIILIAVLGLTYGGMSAARIAVSGDSGPLAGDLVSRITTGDMPLEVRHYGTADEVRDAVERGFVEVGVALPASYEADLRAGRQATVQVMAQAKDIATAVKTAVDEAVARQAAVIRAARFAAANGSGVSFDAALEAAIAEQPKIAGIGLAVDAVSKTAENPNGFAVGAESQVILFMFLTSLTGAVPLIISRQLGISRREYSTPTSAGTIILGEALGRFGLAFGQGIFIVLASALLFGVDWIDPMATTALIFAFALVAAGAAMLIGAVASNASQAGAVGAGLGMFLGLLGGTMVPLEVFPAFMRTLSHVTPHAWAIDAFHDLLLNGPGFVRVLPELGALFGFAAALLALAVWRFRRVIVSGTS